jgi:hypothetical protein
MLLTHNKFEDYIKAEPKKSLVIMSMEKIDGKVLDPENKQRVNVFTREVLKACNVIRPSVSELTYLPINRKRAIEQQDQRTTERTMKTKHKSNT